VGQEASTYEKGSDEEAHKANPTVEGPGACEGLTQENVEEDEERPVTGNTLPNEQPSRSTSDDPSWETNTDVPPMEGPEEGEADRAQGARKYANTDEADEEDAGAIGRILTAVCSEEAEGDAGGDSHTSSAEDER
jgi:hypothetical protein